MVVAVFVRIDESDNSDNRLHETEPPPSMIHCESILTDNNDTSPESRKISPNCPFVVDALEPTSLLGGESIEKAKTVSISC